jgi:uncharacterized protein
MEILKRVFTSEIKGIDEKEGTITAFVSTAARDRMDESLDPKGADLKNYAKNPVVLWAHDYSMPPIGKALWTKRSGEGILSKVKFASTEFAQEIFQLYKEGFLKAFSVGFIPKEHQDGDGEKTARRTYTKWEMLEYSAVPVPANPEALMLAMQKGVLKSDEVKHALEQPKTEEFTDEVIEETPQEPPVEKANGLDELMAENKLLNDTIEILRKDNEATKAELRDLKYKLYVLNNGDTTKEPEITASVLGKMIADGVSGVIRSHQGKIN